MDKNKTVAESDFFRVDYFQCSLIYFISNSYQQYILRMPSIGEIGIEGQTVFYEMTRVSHANDNVEIDILFK